MQNLCFPVRLQKINASITNTVDTMYLDQLVEESRKIKEKGQMQTLGC